MKTAYRHLLSNHEQALAIRDASFAGMEIVDVPVAKAVGPSGMCYQNARQQVLKYGGTVELGWQLLIWPGRFVKALHHAVWKNPEGNLIDVTAPAFSGVTSRTTTFIPIGPEIAPDTLDPVEPSVFYSLDADTSSLGYIKATRDLVIARQDMHDFIRKNDLLKCMVGNVFKAGSVPRDKLTILAIKNAKVRESEAAKFSALAQIMPQAPARPAFVPASPSPYPSTGRNEQCPCGSGKKYKKCHGI